MKRPAITQYIKPSLNKSKVEKAKPYKLHLKTQKPILQNQNAATKKKKEKKRQSAQQSSLLKSFQIRCDQMI